MPYYKWCFRALSESEKLSSLYASLEYLISSGNTPGESKKKIQIIEKICNEIFNELKAQRLTEYSGNTCEGHAYAVNNAIKDNEIRNLHILYAV